MTTFAERLADYERPLTVDELCYELSKSRDTIYEWIKRKRLPAYRNGNSWLFEPRDILDWWEDRRVG